jgi:hypothetical protein
MDGHDLDLENVATRAIHTVVSKHHHARGLFHGDVRRDLAQLLPKQPVPDLVHPLLSIQVVEIVYACAKPLRMGLQRDTYAPHIRLQGRKRKC